MLPLPKLRRLPPAVTEELRRRRAELPLSPCVDQTEEEIGNYYRNAAIGAPAAVRDTRWHTLKYVIRTIEDRNEGRGRVYVTQDGAFYAKHGRNCFHPKGQVSLVVPTEEVLRWAQEHPQGKSGVSIYRHGGLFR